MRQRTCVVVRDRASGAWLDDHKAVSGKIVGSYAFGDLGSGAGEPDVPELGECAFFETDMGQLLTSPVLQVKRPSKDIVQEHYPHAKAKP